MDAVRLNEWDRWLRNPIALLDGMGVIGRAQKLIAEVRASHEECRELKEENERLREQLAADGREDCLLSREASDRALRLTGCMEDAE